MKGRTVEAQASFWEKDTDCPRTRGWLQRVRLAGRQDPGLQAYIDKLRVSNCVGCGRVQYTPGGKPMRCPRCMGKKGTVDRPSIPMRAQTEMAQRKGRGPDLEPLGAGAGDPGAGRRRR